MSEMEVTEGQLLSQDFGVGGPPAAAEAPLLSVDSGKTPDILAAEIRTIKNQTGRMVLNASIEVGRRLTEAKAKLPHGSWGEYLKNEVDYSPSQAQNLMRVFREYGSDQQSLFGGEAKSQTFGNLTYSKALSLLAIPDEEERERFAVENDVEHMSVRELNEALKARNEAEEKAAAAEEAARGLRQETERLQKELADQSRVYEAKLTSAGVEADMARTDAQTAEDRIREYEMKMEAARVQAKTTTEALNKKTAELSKLEAQLEELRSRPAEADTAAVEAARKAAIAEMETVVSQAQEAREKAEECRRTAEEGLAAAQKELADLKAKGPQVRELTPEELQAMTAGEVEKAQAAAAERMQMLEKQLARADPDTVAFKVFFTDWQETYQKLTAALQKIRASDPEKGQRLEAAVEAALEQMKAYRAGK